MRNTGRSTGSRGSSFLPRRGIFSIRSLIRSMATTPSPASSPLGQRLILITGGARSGKSRHAQDLALQYNGHASGQANGRANGQSGGRPIYVATAHAWDDEFKQRIRIHQQDRDDRWRSIEEERNLSRLPLKGEVAVIDCVTLWITNFFSDFHGDVDACLDVCRREIDELMKKDAVLILITNELGMGMHAD